MSSINLSWDADGAIDSYTIYRSESPMSVDGLPAPLADGVTDKTYSDTTVVDGTTYYYRVASVRNAAAKISDEVVVLAETPTGDIYFSDVVSLNHFNGVNGGTTFTDEKGLTWSGIGGVTTTTSLSKFGGSSGQFATGKYLRMPANANFTFNSTEDFTIESWVYIPTGATLLSGVIPILTVGWLNTSSAGGGWNVVANTSGYVVFEKCLTNNTAIQLAFSTGGSFPRDAWAHVEIGRASGVVYGFLNGDLLGTSSSLNGIAVTNPNNLPILIGSGNNGSNENYYLLNGNLDDLRVTKGVCRHTASFTPPNQQLPNQ